jgi:glycosyltransferase involved in cell wall biosynthesis
MRVSLIITTYNRPDALMQVLRSIENQSSFPDEIIIADDGSNILTKKCITNFTKSSPLKVIHSWQNDKGFRVSRSRNQALSKSTGDYIILIDGDVILHQKFIEDHLKHAENGYFIQGTRVLINQELTTKILGDFSNEFSFFSKGLSNRKNSLHSNLLSRLFLKKKKYIKGIKTCNMSFFKNDCIKINGFNNDIEGWGREDSEFVVRLFNIGISRKNVYFNSIQFHLWHENSSRVSLKKNEAILEVTIHNMLKRCQNGLNIFD